ncbi:twin-arginine translocase subunit TatC [Siminovitchia fortis]|nr:twin-arginine translocase subunit TatC [Siminovitchia fortis]WHY83725.1 twin-arginine translocase subunit TatC [Siminovitchia fortis]
MDRPYYRKEKQEEETNGEALVEHLADLRKQLIKSLAVFVVFLLVVFTTMNYWFPYVTKGNELVVFGPFQIVKFYTSICVTLALGLSLPFLVHFIWQFVKPGLKSNEIRFLGLYSPAMFLLFIMGVAFGYFVVNPLSYHFLMNFGAMNFDVIVSAQEYVHFLIMTTVPLGLLFELPIVAMFLASIGVLTSETMKKVRKWAYLAIAVVSALITPPDFISQLMVLIPMALLYEASIYIVKRMEARQETAQQTEVVSTE